MLSIKRDFRLTDFEYGLAELGGGESDLRIPNHVNASAVGALAALIQLVITWARRSSEAPRLRVYAKDSSDAALANLVCTPFGLTAINMASQIKAVDESEIRRRDALLLAVDYVKTMHAGSLDRLRDFDKSRLPIICIDNARELRRPTRLYVPGTDQVRDRREFESVVSACVTTLRPRLRPIEPALVAMMAGLLQEAFQNTHDHAQTDFCGGALRRSIRGILIAHHAVEARGLAAMAGDHLPLQRYFANWQPRFSGARDAQFVELSIFDSGPGLAQSWLRKTRGLARPIADEPIPLAEEFAAVSACLAKGGTTKTGSTSGNGLFRIVEIVRRSGGFIRIRSGRLSLIKAYDGAATISPGAPNLNMEDMVAGGTPVIARPWAEGTVLTAMLPLNRRGNP
jgi:hypothetical protein